MTHGQLIHTSNMNSTSHNNLLVFFFVVDKYDKILTYRL